MCRALVLYNAVAAGLAAAGPHNPETFELQVAGNQLAELCHTAEQQTVLAMPGRDVLVRTGTITPAQVRTHRPSYVNAILIQRAGALIPGGCNRCRLERPGLSPFPECRFVRGHYGNACGNCKWRDHAARCQHGAVDGNDEAPDDGAPRLPQPRTGGGSRGGLNGGRLALPAPGSQGNPILL